MATDFSRRRLLAAGAGAPLAGAAAGQASAAPGARSSGASPLGVREEKRALDELYEAAVAEGGKLVLHQGGDVDSQAAGVRAGAFPKVGLTVVVDYSKYHDVRVDNQLATGTLVPDVVQLQTLQDFTRWKRQGKLVPTSPSASPRCTRASRTPKAPGRR